MMVIYDIAPLLGLLKLLTSPGVVTIQCLCISADVED